MNYNIVGINWDGELQFLYKLYGNWVSVKDKELALSFTESEIDSILTLVEYGNKDFFLITKISDVVEW